MTTLHSRVQLGKMYKDARSQIEGHATVVCFQVHGCIEVNLEYMKDGKPESILVNELRLVAAGGAKLESTHIYETDLVFGHEYEDIQTGLKGHMAVIEFHEFMATRGILRRVATDAKGFDTIKYLSIDDFLLRDIETQQVAEDKSGKRSPVTHEVERR